MSSQTIFSCVQAFWDQEMNKLESETRVAIQMKIQIIDGQFRSISKVQVITKEELDVIKELFASSYLDCDDFYLSFVVTNIIISYKF